MKQAKQALCSCACQKLAKLGKSNGRGLCHQRPPHQMFSGSRAGRLCGKLGLRMEGCTLQRSYLSCLWGVQTKGWWELLVGAFWFLVMGRGLGRSAEGMCVCMRGLVNGDR